MIITPEYIPLTGISPLKIHLVWSHLLMRLNLFTNRKAKEPNQDQLLRRNFRKHFRRKRKEARRKKIRKFFSAFFAGNTRQAIKKKQETSPGTMVPDYSQATQIQLLKLLSAETGAQFSATPKRKDKLTFLYSSLACLVSAVMAFLIYHYTIIFTAAFFGIPIELEHLRFHYLLGPGSPQYSRISVIAIFLSGPVLLLAISILSFLLFMKSNPNHRLLRYYMLWMMVFGMNYFFGSIITGIITRTETVYATQWIMLNPVYDPAEFFLVLVSLFFLLLTGYLVSPMFAAASIGKSSPRSSLSGLKLYSPFLEIIAPWLFTLILMFVISRPYYYLPLIIRTILPMIVLLPVALRIKSIPVKRLWKYGIYEMRED